MKLTDISVQFTTKKAVNHTSIFVKIIEMLWNHYFNLETQ